MNHPDSIIKSTIQKAIEKATKERDAERASVDEAISRDPEPEQDATPEVLHERLLAGDMDGAERILAILGDEVDVKDVIADAMLLIEADPHKHPLIQARVDAYEKHTNGDDLRSLVAGEREGVIEGLEVTSGGDSYAVITKDASVDDGVRATYYGEHGLNGHSSYPDYEAALDGVIGQGYLTVAEGSLERLQKRWPAYVAPEAIAQVGEPAADQGKGLVPDLCWADPQGVEVVAGRLLAPKENGGWDVELAYPDGAIEVICVDANDECLKDALERSISVSEYRELVGNLGKITLPTTIGTLTLESPAVFLSREDFEAAAEVALDAFIDKQYDAAVNKAREVFSPKVIAEADRIERSVKGTPAHSPNTWTTAALLARAENDAQLSAHIQLSRVVSAKQDAGELKKAVVANARKAWRRPQEFRLPKVPEMPPKSSVAVASLPGELLDRCGGVEGIIKLSQFDRLVIANGYTHEGANDLLEKVIEVFPCNFTADEFKAALGEKDPSILEREIDSMTERVSSTDDISNYQGLSGLDAVQEWKVIVAMARKVGAEQEWVVNNRDLVQSVRERLLGKHGVLTESAERSVRIRLKLITSGGVQVAPEIIDEVLNDRTPLAPLAGDHYERNPDKAFELVKAAFPDAQLNEYKINSSVPKGAFFISTGKGEQRYTLHRDGDGFYCNLTESAEYALLKALEIAGENPVYFDKNFVLNDIERNQTGLSGAASESDSDITPLPKDDTLSTSAGQAPEGEREQEATIDEPAFDPNEVLTFGKYQGQELRDVAAKDLSYLVYLNDKNAFRKHPGLQAGVDFYIEEDRKANPQEYTIKPEDMTDELVDGTLKLGFGKHGDAPIAAVARTDIGYLKWLKNEGGIHRQSVKMQNAINYYLYKHQTLADEIEASVDVDDVFDELGIEYSYSKRGDEYQVVFTGIPNTIAGTKMRHALRKGYLAQFNSESAIVEIAEDERWNEPPVEVAKRDVAASIELARQWIQPLREELLSMAGNSMPEDVEQTHVRDDVKNLINRGRDFNISQDVLNNQIEDIARIVYQEEQDSGVYLLANEAGTGKTMVIAGAIDELKHRGRVDDVVYITLNKDLVAQVKADIKDYDCDHVRYYTYTDLRDGKVDVYPSTMLVFDEIHAIENMNSVQGAAAQRVIDDAGFVLAASATAARNPAKMAFLERAGLFDVNGLKAEHVLPAFGVVIDRWKNAPPVYRWTQDTTSASAFNEWLNRRGIISSREMRLPENQVEMAFKVSAISPVWKERYEQVDEIINDLVNSTAMANYAKKISDYGQNLRKRIMEAALLPASALAAVEAMDRGRFPIIFTETRSERKVGFWRRADGTGPLYSSQEVIEMMGEYEAERGAGITSEAPPFSRMITELAKEFHLRGVEFTIPSSYDVITRAVGKRDVASYTGDVTASSASKELELWRSGEKRLLHATIKKGGTGLTLHDKVGNHQTTQILNVLPWDAREVDQVLGRTARYGLQGVAEIIGMVAPELEIQRVLATNVAQRMDDLGATLKNKKSDIASEVRKVIEQDTSSPISREGLLISGDLSPESYLKEHGVDLEKYKAVVQLHPSQRPEVEYYAQIDAMKDALTDMASIYKNGAFTDKGRQIFDAITNSEAALSNPLDNEDIPKTIRDRFEKRMEAATLTAADDRQKVLQRLNNNAVMRLARRNAPALDEVNEPIEQNNEETVSETVAGAPIRDIEGSSNEDAPTVDPVLNNEVQSDLFGTPVLGVKKISGPLRGYIYAPKEESGKLSRVEALNSAIDVVMSAKGTELEFLKHLSDQATFGKQRRMVHVQAAAAAMQAIRGENVSIPDELNALIPTPYVDPELNPLTRLRDYYKAFEASPDRNKNAPEHLDSKYAKPLDESEVIERPTEEETIYTEATPDELVEMPLDEQNFLKLVDVYGDLMRDADVRERPDVGEYISAEEAEKRLDGWKKRAEEQFADPKVRNRNNDKWVLSFFDRTGKWAQPWREAGYNVLTFDIQSNTDLAEVNAEYFHKLIEQQGITEVYHIILATPCTDFANSGARWFAEKDADGRTEISKHLVFQSMRIVEFFRPKGGWSLENPMGRIERLTNLPKARFTFQPNNFGADYTKETTLWGDFQTDLPTANVEPVRGTKMHSEYGGKSLLTKNARSETPEGFAYAYFMANNYEDLSPENKLRVDFRENQNAIAGGLQAGLTPDAIRAIVELGYGDEEYHANAENLLTLKRSIDEGLSPEAASQVAAEYAGKRNTSRIDIESVKAELDVLLRESLDVQKTAGKEPVAPLIEGTAVSREGITDSVYIPGAAKERFAEYRARIKKELTDEEIKTMSLSETVPVPDYEKLIEASSDPRSLAMVAVLRESIGRKPNRMGPSVARKYIEKVRSMRELIDLVLNETDVDTLEDVFINSRKDEPSYASDGALVYSRYQLLKQLPPKYIRHSAKIHCGKAMSGGYQYGVLKKAGYFADGWPANTHNIEAFDPEQLEKIAASLDERITRESSQRSKKGLGFKLELFQRTRPANGESRYFVGIRKSGEGVVSFSECPENLAKAERYEWAAEEKARLEPILAERKEYSLRTKVNAERMGRDWRQGRDITTEELDSEFGLRGIQYGNSILKSSGEAQEHLNHAYDALSDLAFVTGLPRKAIGLDGSLALAFGARGRGGKRAALAHFEPMQVVINLTRKNGAGSLAHEWWHALDNYLYKVNRSTNPESIRDLESIAIRYQSEQSLGANKGRLREQMVRSVGEVKQRLQGSPMEQASREMDALFGGKVYWSTMREMSARAFESYVKKKLHDHGAQNDYLVNLNIDPESENMDGVVPTFYGLREMGLETAFDEVFTTLEYTEEAAPVTLYKKEYDYAPVVQAWREAGAADDDMFRFPKYFGSSARQISVETGLHINDAPGIAEHQMRFLRANGYDVLPNAAWEIFNPETQDEPVYLYENDDSVWIDLSNLDSGIGGGAEVYQIAASYAYNTGKKLIGDPEGLSPMASFRRTESMLASALKYGTTKHLEPADSQVSPEYNPVAMPEPLKWGENDSDNIAELLRVSYTNVLKLHPEIEHVDYDYEHAEFVTREGSADPDGVVDRLVEYLNGRSTEYVSPSHVFQRELSDIERSMAGSATLKRAVITQSLLSAQNEASWRPDLAAHVRELLAAEAVNSPLSSVLYRHDQSPQAQSRKVAQVRDWIKPIEAATGVSVLVVPTAGDLPAPIATSIQPSSPAVYDVTTKTPYVIADRIRSERHARECALHEGLGHAGVISFIERNQEMGGAEFNTLLDQMFDELDVADIRAKTMAYGFDFSKAKDRREAVLEYIAHIAETGERPVNTDRLMQAGQSMFNEATDENWTYNDVLELIETSRLFVLAERMEQNGALCHDPAERKRRRQETFRKVMDGASERFRKLMNGEEGPLVYHGAAETFDRFDHTMARSGMGDQVLGFGHYLTDSFSEADIYAEYVGGYDGSVMEVAVPLHTYNLLDLDNPLYEQSEYVQDMLKSAGMYDPELADRYGNYQSEVLRATENEDDNRLAVLLNEFPGKRGQEEYRRSQMTGADLYAEIVESVTWDDRGWVQILPVSERENANTAQQMASAILNRCGIRGAMKDLGRKTHYVIYDELYTPVVVNGKPLSPISEYDFLRNVHAAVIAEQGLTPVRQRPDVLAELEETVLKDQYGEPIPLYRGDDGVFNPQQMSQEGTWGSGSYWFTSAELAYDFGDNITTAYANIRNPWRVENAWDSALSDEYDFDAPSIDAVLALPGGKTLVNRAIAEDRWFDAELQNHLIGLGYDGIIASNPDGTAEVVAFYPEQIIAAEYAAGVAPETLKVAADIAAVSTPDAEFEPAPDAQQQLAEWMNGSVVTTPEGEPLVVYRGQHSGADGIESRGGAISFGDAATASTYAATPNNKNDQAIAPAVMPVFLSIKNPIINNPDDPFIDLWVVEDALGERVATDVAIKHADHIYNTDNWSELSDQYGVENIESLIKQHPEAIRDLYLDAYPVFDDPALVAVMQAAGYDGAIHDGNGVSAGKVEYKVFSEDQVRSAITPSRPFTQTPVRRTDTPAFKGWFGQSKAVDASGKPVVFYHGTRSDFTEFGNIGARYPQSKGFYFTSSATKASVYADSQRNGFNDWDPESQFVQEVESGANVLPVYLAMHNPKIVYASESGLMNGEGFFDADNGAAVDQAQKDGHDGILFIRDYGDEYDYTDAVVFDNTQIKSAIGNTGKYAVNNPNILEKRVYHGTNVKFERMSLEHASAAKRATEVTVEPWGLHFTDDQEVAEYYRNSRILEAAVNRYGSDYQPEKLRRFSHLLREVNDRVSSTLRIYASEAGPRLAGAGSVAGVIKNFLNRHEHDREYYEAHKEQIESKIEAVRDQIRSAHPDMADAEVEQLMDKLGMFDARTPYSVAYKSAKEVFASYGEQFPDGYVYASDIPDPEQMLVAGEQVSYDKIERLADVLDTMGFDPLVEALGKPDMKVTGEALYTWLYSAFQDRQAVSEAFDKAGIPGIYYPSEMRYVVWDSDSVRIEDVISQDQQATILDRTGSMDAVNAHCEASHAEQHAPDAPAVLEKRVYHGSRHDFDRFSLEAVGTGTGQYNEGWGLYFAGERAIAEYYKTKTLPTPRLLRNGEPFTDGVLPDSSVEDKALRLYADVAKRRVTEENAALPETRIEVLKESVREQTFELANIRSQLERYERIIATADDVEPEELQMADALRDRAIEQQAILDALIVLDTSTIEWQTGRMYQAQIPDEHELLDYTVTMAEHSDEIKARLTDAGIPVTDDMTGEDVYRAVVRMADEQWAQSQGTIYDTFIKHNPNRLTMDLDEVASRYLGYIGIPGATFQGATMPVIAGLEKNYVIWDADRISIETVHDQRRQAEALVDRDISDTVGLSVAEDPFNPERVQGIHGCSFSGKRVIDTGEQFADRESSDLSLEQQAAILIARFGMRQRWWPESSHTGVAAMAIRDAYRAQQGYVDGLIEYKEQVQATLDAADDVNASAELVATVDDTNKDLEYAQALLQAIKNTDPEEFVWDTGAGRVRDRSIPNDPQKTDSRTQIARYKAESKLQQLVEKRAGNVLAQRLPREFKDQGHLSLVGQKVANAEELASLAEIYRDPRFETLRIFYVKDDALVGQNSLTCRLPGQVSFVNEWPQIAEAMKIQMDTLNADGYWLFHNHPNGDPEPSRADLHSTLAFAKEVTGLKGHIVINGTRFAEINVMNDLQGQPIATETLIHDANLQDNSYGPEVLVPHHEINTQIRGSKHLAALASQVRHGDNTFQIVGTGNGQVKTIVSYDTVAFRQAVDTAENGAIAVLNDYIDDLNRYDAHDDVYITNPEPWMGGLMRTAVRIGLVSDVILPGEIGGVRAYSNLMDTPEAELEVDFDIAEGTEPLHLDVYTPIAQMDYKAQDALAELGYRPEVVSDEQLMKNGWHEIKVRRTGMMTLPKDTADALTSAFDEGASAFRAAIEEHSDRLTDHLEQALIGNPWRGVNVLQDLMQQYGNAAIPMLVGVGFVGVNDERGQGNMRWSEVGVSTSLGGTGKQVLVTRELPAEKRRQEVLRKLLNSPERILADTKIRGRDGNPTRLYRGGMSQSNNDTLDVADSFGQALFGQGVYMTTNPEDAARYASSDVEVNWDITEKAVAYNNLNGGDLSHTDAKAAVTGAGFVTPLYANIRNPLTLHNRPHNATKEQFIFAFRETVAFTDAPDVVEELWQGFASAKTARAQLDKLSNYTPLLRSLATLQGYDGLLVTSEALRMRDKETVHVVAFESDQVVPATYYDAAVSRKATTGNAKGMSKQFESWFDQSKVVDPEGQPLRVFHGTDQPIADTFREAGDRFGFVFATRRESAENMAGNFGHVVEAHLRINNPLDLTNDPNAWDKFAKYDRTAYERMKSAGYDGAILRMPEDDTFAQNETVYIAFDARQIKSATANIGTYEPASRNYLRKVESVDPTEDLLPGMRVHNLKEKQLRKVHAVRVKEADAAASRLRERFDDLPEIIEKRVVALLLTPETPINQVTMTMLDWMSDENTNFLVANFRELSRVVRNEVEAVKLATDRARQGTDAAYYLSLAQPLSMQSQEVQNALLTLGFVEPEETTGADIVKQLVAEFGNHERAADLLVAGGIYGVRTFSGDFVVFNETPDDVVQKNDRDELSNLSVFEQNLWRSALNLGMDMNDDARLSRAELMGFRTSMPVTPVAERVANEYQRSEDELFRFVVPRNAAYSKTGEQAFVRFDKPFMASSYKEYLETDRQTLVDDGFDAVMWIENDASVETTPPVAVAVLETAQVAHTNSTFITPTQPDNLKVNQSTAISPATSAVYFPASAAVNAAVAVPRVGPAGSGVYFSQEPAVASRLVEATGSDAMRSIIRDVDSVLAEKLGISPSVENQARIGRGQIMECPQMTITDDGIDLNGQMIDWRSLTLSLRNAGIANPGAIIGSVVGKTAGRGREFVARLNQSGNHRALNRLAEVLGASVVNFEGTLPGFEGRDIGLAIRPEVVLADGATPGQSHLPKMLAKLESQALEERLEYGDLQLDQTLTARLAAWNTSEVDFKHRLAQAGMEFDETYSSLKLNNDGAALEVGTQLLSDYALTLDAYGPESGAFNVVRIVGMSGQPDALSELIGDLKGVNGVDVVYLGNNTTMTAETRWFADSMGAYSSPDGGRFISVSDRAAERERCNVRHLFAGEAARTADKAALKKAQVAVGGNVSDRVRQFAWELTGWLPGTDGEWRFEISDADAKLTSKVTSMLKSLPSEGAALLERDLRTADAQFNDRLYKLIGAESVRYGIDRKVGLGGASYSLLHGAPQLAEVFDRVYQRECADYLEHLLAQVEDDALRAAMKAPYSHAMAHAAEVLGSDYKNTLIDMPMMRLSEVLQHDALYDAYPGMQDIWVKLVPGNREYGGAFYESSAIGPVIEVNANGLTGDKLISILCHELQHAIQSVEGFARGGTEGPETVAWAETYLTKALRNERVSPEYQRYVSAAQDLKYWNNLKKYEALLKYKTSENITRVGRHITGMIGPQHKRKIIDRFGVRPRRHNRRASREWLENVALYLLQDEARKFEENFGRKIREEYQTHIEHDGVNAIRNGAKRAERKYYKALDHTERERHIGRTLSQVQTLTSSYDGSEKLYRHLAGEVEARAVQNRLKNGTAPLSEAFDVRPEYEVAIATQPNPNYREYMISRDQHAGTNINIVNGPEAMPDEVRNSAVADGKASAGATVGGEIYVDSNAPDPKSVVDHEKAHLSVRSIFGRSLDPSYERLWLGIGQEPGMRKEASNVGFSMDAYFDASNRLLKNGTIRHGQRIEMLVDEFVAHAIEHRNKRSLSQKAKGLVSELIGAARNKLAKSGVKFDSVTDADIAYTLKIVNDAVRYGHDNARLPVTIANHGPAKLHRDRKHMESILHRLTGTTESYAIELAQGTVVLDYPVGVAVSVALIEGVSLTADTLQKTLMEEYGRAGSVNEVAKEAFNIGLNRIAEMVENRGINSKVITQVMEFEDMMQRTARDHGISLEFDPNKGKDRAVDNAPAPG